MDYKIKGIPKWCQDELKFQIRQLMKYKGHFKIQQYFIRNSSLNASNFLKVLS